MLTQIARKMLAITASSAKSERFFSTRGLPEKDEELIVIKQNLSKVKLFLSSSNYKIKLGAKNAFDAIIVHTTAGEVLEVSVEDMYDLENEYSDAEVMDILE